MSQSEPGASSLTARFHHAYGTAGGLANGAAYDLSGHAPMSYGDAVRERVRASKQGRTPAKAPAEGN